MHKTDNQISFQTPTLAPVFYPNEDEFYDALGYIAKIKPIAERIGICKIVPPKSWQPNFCLDSQKFKFTPRIQKINELEVELLSLFLKNKRTDTFLGGYKNKIELFR